MKSIYMKISGHIVEKGVILAAQELIEEYENSDLREIKLYIPSLKAGIGERAPSTISFYLTAPEDTIDEIHDVVMRLLKENDIMVIHCEHCEDKKSEW